VSGASDAIARPEDRRKLVAVLYADMVGYSRLIGLDDAGTLERLRALRRDVIDPAVHRHGGRIVQTGGDSLLIVFDSIDGAVRCAVTIQEQIPDFDGDQPADRAIRFRIGINVGDAIADGTDLHGDAVNVAARLQAECPPGGICVSRPVRDHVQDRLGLGFQELGAIRLKNIARPVEAFVLPPTYRGPQAAAAASAPLSNVERTPRLSVVVLPFRTLGRKSDKDDLADAITDDLTVDLARIPGVLAVAHASAARYGDGGAADVRRIGRELGVRYAVEGAIRKLGDSLRISVHLIATETGQQIWADRFDEKSENLAVHHDAVVRRISTTIDSRMLDAEVTNTLRERPHNPGALDLLLQAWSRFKSPTQQHMVEATDLLEQALRLEPNMVPAILSLADRLIHRHVTPDTIDWGNPDLIDHAAELLSRAEKIEPNDEWLMFYQGSLLRARGHWNEASLVLQRLIESHPNNYAAHRMLGRCAMIMGRPDEAVPLFETAVRLNPLSALNRNSSTMIGHCLLLQGKATAAIDWLQRGIGVMPESERRSRGRQTLYLASAYALTGDMERAAQALNEATRCWPFGTIHSLWPFYEPRGLPAEAYAKQFQYVQEGLRLAGLRPYADEASDSGVAPTQSLWPDPVGLTPTSCPGATTIATVELADLLTERRPIVIDVALGSWGRTLPGAIGLQGTGHGAEFSEGSQERFSRVILDLIEGDLAAPIVALCANSEGFSAYNLALRLVALGCRNVYWYRGGVEAWQANHRPARELTLREW
jgi:class 3 adenylate cyclase/TolB-like protein/tetratricopeptide (TPR) repeat protein